MSRVLALGAIGLSALAVGCGGAGDAASPSTRLSDGAPGVSAVAAPAHAGALVAAEPNVVASADEPLAAGPYRDQSCWPIPPVRGAADFPCSAGGAGSASPLASIAPEQLTTSISGGTAAQQGLLRDILAGLGVDPGVALELRDVPASGLGVDTGTALVVPQAAIDDMWTGWIVQLVAGALISRSAEEGLPPVVGIASSQFDDTGRRHPVWPTSGDPPAATESAARTLAASARQAVEAAGARVERLVVLAPDGLVLGLTIGLDPGSDTRETARFLKSRGKQLVEALVARTDLDGAWIELVDDAGVAWWFASTARLAGGRGGQRPELIACSPIERWGPHYEDPSQEPTCPA